MHFGRAAEREHIVQSALSQQVSAWSVSWGSASSATRTTSH
ncbi:MAG TPA: hypothetical protein VH307_09295 [Streptosporangiaceae bacterium]|nr:hypothetical protein [Streptosporangiaceae bacterium]